MCADQTVVVVAIIEIWKLMLTSFRSLVPKNWNSDHETAWTWFWDNVERMLKNLMDKPAIQGKALTKCVESWEEKIHNDVRREVYVGQVKATGCLHSFDRKKDLF